MTLIWSPTALADLKHIRTYIAEHNPAAANEIVETVRAAVHRLEQFPFVGRVGRVSDTRELVIAGTPYVVPYRVRGTGIEIVAVMHGAQQWPDVF